MISHKHKFIFVHIPKNAGSSFEILSGEEKGLHKNISYYLNKSSNSKNYFKFAIARNPWDRFISLYHYYIGGSSRYKFNGIPVSFTEFARRFNDGDPMLARHIWEKHYLPQIDFITHNSMVNYLDFIGRFENLQEDFNTICNKIGIAQQKLPHKNKSKHKHYTEYYDDETRQIVAEKYAKDIEYFGYKFGK